MKLLLINDHVSISGGGDTVLNIERNYFRQIGWQVATLGFSSSTERADTYFLIPESPSPAVRKLRKFTYPIHSKVISAAINDFGPDIIHLHLNSRHPLSVLKALKHSSARIVYTVHGPNFLCATGWGGLRDGSPCPLGITTKCVSKGCVRAHEFALHKNLAVHTARRHSVIDVFLAPSKWIMGHLTRAGLNNVIHTPLGVESAFFHGKPQEFSTKKINLLYVGALVQQKGVEKLPLILAELNAKRDTTFTLHIAGSGPMKGILEQGFKEMNMDDHVFWLGHVRRRQMVEVYDAADILIMPSIWQEQFGLVGPEANARGLPAVASNVGGIPEWLLDGYNGKLGIPNNVESFVKGVDQVVQNYSQYSRNARLSSERFHETSYCKSLQSIFESL